MTEILDKIINNAGLSTEKQQLDFAHIIANMAEDEEDQQTTTIEGQEGASLLVGPLALEKHPDSEQQTEQTVELAFNEESNEERESGIGRRRRFR